MKKVITYGTFDLFHLGHYNILKRAKEYGDYLIVGVTSESYDIERGKLSVKDSLTTRIQNVMNTGFADEVIIEEYIGQKIRDIIKYDIDVIVIGADWKGKFDHLRQYCEVVYLERTKNISSTQIREEKSNIYKLGIVTDSTDDQGLLREVKYVSGIHIESVFSKDKNVSENFCEKYQVNQSFIQYDKFLNSIDIVLINSCIKDRYSYIKNAIMLGKHVISASPITLSLTEHKELFELAEKNKVILIENISTVYLRAFMQILWMTNGDTLGKILKVKCSLSLENFTPKKSFSDALVLGIVMIIKLLGNEFEHVNVVNYKNKVHYLNVLFENNDSFGTIEISNDLELENKLVIVGENGTIVVENDWWNTSYFEFKQVEEKFEKRYCYNFNGNGFRYVLQELLIMLSDNTIESTRFFKNESEMLIKLLNKVNIDNCND